MWYVGRIQIFLTYFLAALALSSCKFPFSKAGEENTPGSASSVSATPYFTISALDSAVVPNGCHQFRVTFRDVAGNPASIEERTTVYITTTSGVQAYRNDDCTQNLNYLTFSPSNTSKIFYAKATTAQLFTLIADAGDSEISTGSTSVTMSAFGPAHASNSSIVGSSNVAADGSTSSSVTITLKDKYGNSVVGETPSFTVTGDSNTLGSCPATDSNGVAVCSLKSTKAESKTLSLSSPLSMSGGAVTFVAGAAHHMSVTSAPTSVGSNAAFTVVVSILDEHGNLATTPNYGVTLTEDADNPLSGGDSADSSGGTVTFSNVKLLTSGSGKKIKATSSLGTALSGDITVTTGAADHLKVTTNSTAISGVGFSVTVEVVDASGNLVPSESQTITLTEKNSDPLAGGDPTTSTLGQVSYSSVKLTKAGSNKKVVATSSGGLTGESTAITVDPGGIHHLAVSSSNSVTSGTGFSVTVQVRDISENVVTTPNLSVVLTEDSGLTISGGDSQDTSAGEVTFSAVKIFSAGSGRKIKATSGSYTGLSGSITVNSGGPHHLVVTGAPASTTSGSGFPLTVQIVDEGGNILTGETQGIYLTESSGDNLTGGDSTPAVAGQVTFSAVTLTKAGSNKKVVATSTGGLTGETSAITVNAGLIHHLKVAASVSAITAGATFSVDVTAVDEHENTVVGPSVIVELTEDGGTVPASTVLGVVSFTGVKLKTAGTGKKVLAASGGYTGSSGDITVNPASPHHLTVGSTPPSIAAGTTFAVSVSVRDEFENLVKTGSHSVGLTEVGGIVVSGGNASSTSNGEIEFGAVSFASVGIAKLKATAMTLPNPDAYSAEIVVTGAGGGPEGVAHHLTLTSYSSSIQAGTAMSVTVQVVDENGVPVTGGSYSVTLHDNQNDPSEGGSAKFTNNGTVTFSAFKLHKAGTGRSIRADCQELNSGVTTDIEVTVAAPHHLKFSPVANTTAAGLAFTGTVSVMDQYENLVTTPNYDITFSEVGGDPVVGAEGGATSGGERTFSFALTKAGSGKKIKASTISPNTLEDAVTESIEVDPAGFDHLKFTSSNSLIAGSCHDLVVEARDEYENTITQKSNFNVLLTTYEGRDAFFVDSCGAMGTGQMAETYTIASGQSSVTAKYKDGVAGGMKFIGLVSNQTKGEQTATIDPAARHRLELSVSATSPTVGQCVAITATVKDQFNNTRLAGDVLNIAVTAKGNGKLFSESDCSAGSEITGNVEIDDEVNFRTIYFRNTKAEENTLVFSDNVNFAQSFVASKITWGSSVTKLVITGSESIAVDACTDYELSRQDAFGNRIAVEGDTAFEISTPGGGLYKGSGCLNTPSGMINITVSTGASYTFSYKSSTATTTSLAALQVLGGLTVQLPITVSSVSVLTSIEFTSGTSYISMAGISPPPCSPYTITLKDGSGSNYVAPADIPITLTSSNVYTNFSNDSTCQTKVSGLRSLFDEGGNGTPRVLSGQSTFTFFMRQPVADSNLVLTASGGGKVATKNVNVGDGRSLGTAVRFDVVLPILKAGDNECTAISVTLRDRYGNAVSATGSEEFYPVFYAKDGSQLNVGIYDDYQCGIAQLAGPKRFQASTPSKQFWVRYNTSVEFDFYAMHASNEIAHAFASGSFKGGYLDTTFYAGGIKYRSTQSTMHAYYLMRTDATASRNSASQYFYSVFAGHNDSDSSLKAEIYDDTGNLLREIDDYMGLGETASVTAKAITQTYDSFSKLVIAGTAGEQDFVFGIYDVGTGTRMNSTANYFFESGTSAEVYGVAVKKSGGNDLITIVGSVSGQKTILRVNQYGAPAPGFGNDGVTPPVPGAVKAITYDPVSDKTYVASTDANGYSIQLLSDSGALSDLNIVLPLASPNCSSLDPKSMAIQRTDNKNYLWTAFDCMDVSLAKGAAFVVIDLDSPDKDVVTMGGQTRLVILRSTVAPGSFNFELNQIHVADDKIMFGYTATSSVGRKGVGIARLTANGVLDTSYNDNGYFLDFFSAQFVNANIYHLGFGLDRFDRVSFGSRVQQTAVPYGMYSMIGRLIP